MVWKQKRKQKQKNKKQTISSLQKIRTHSGYEPLYFYRMIKLQTLAILTLICEAPLSFFSSFFNVTFISNPNHDQLGDNRDKDEILTQNSCGNFSFVETLPWALLIWEWHRGITCWFYTIIHVLFVPFKLSKNDYYSYYLKSQLLFRILRTRHFWWMCFCIGHDMG